MREFDELDPAYQYSSALVFFDRHVGLYLEIGATIVSGRKMDPQWNMSQLVALADKHLRWLKIGMEEWIPPPEQIRRPH